MNTTSFSLQHEKVGLTLSGGGMRGMAHIGVLKALDEFGIKPSIISGTSAGALIGAFYSLGLTPTTMQELAKERTFFSRSAFKLSKNGLFSGDFILKLLADYFPNDNFNTLKIPLYVAVTELTHGRIEFFSEGSLFNVLLASSSIPLVFSPVRINDKLYVDGGVLDNLPIEPLVHQCDFIIGSHVNALSFQDEPKISLLKELDRVLHLAIASSVYSKAQLCDLFLDPPNMSNYSLFKKNNTDEMIEMTYDYTCEKLTTLFKDI